MGSDHILRRYRDHVPVVLRYGETDEGIVIQEAFSIFKIRRELAFFAEMCYNILTKKDSDIVNSGVLKGTFSDVDVTIKISEKAAILNATKEKRQLIYSANAQITVFAVDA